MANYHDFPNARKLGAIVGRCRRALRTLSRIDSIAGCGASGLTIGAALAYATNKHLIVIRKSNEDCHANTHTFPDNSGRICIIDDFMATGDTLRHIINAIEWTQYTPTCILLYGLLPGGAKKSYRSRTLDGWTQVRPGIFLPTPTNKEHTNV